MEKSWKPLSQSPGETRGVLRALEQLTETEGSRTRAKWTLQETAMHPLMENLSKQDKGGESQTYVRPSLFKCHSLDMHGNVMNLQTYFLVVKKYTKKKEKKKIWKGKGKTRRDETWQVEATQKASTDLRFSPGVKSYPRFMNDVICLVWTK